MDLSKQLSLSNYAFSSTHRSKIIVSNLQQGILSNRRWFPKELRVCQETRSAVRQRQKIVGCAEAAPANGPSPNGQAVVEDEIETSQGVVSVLDEEQATIDFLGESTCGNLHFIDRVKEDGISNVLGLDSVQDILEVPFESIKEATKTVLEELEIAPESAAGSPLRAIYCSRTLNLRSIQAVGYDMDYTLIHYDMAAWEGKAYEYGMRWLAEQGCPVDGLKFDPTLVTRGLIIDKELGNMVKVDRFGYVKRAMHGTRMLTWAELHSTYGRELVNLRSETRWEFLNTLFSVSEGVMYMQMVDRLDNGEISQDVVGHSYTALWKLVGKALFKAHVEGKLKAEILAQPEKYVELDPDMAATLLDQKQAGKLLLLVTNSDYHYTSHMMSFAYNRFLPDGMVWRDLFDMVIVNARKPEFFKHNMSLFEIVNEEGLMRPAYTIKPGGLYCGGSARMVEECLGVSGDAILYVGDHIYTDAALAKLNFRWRTCLIVRELEQEVEALAKGRPHRHKLKDMMNKKELLGDVLNQLRLLRQRVANRPLDPQGHNECQLEEGEAMSETLAQLLMVNDLLDRTIGPMVEQDGRDFNRRWGYLSRAGVNDKSQFTRQIEKYADIYTSRVSNFLRYTPFVYFRSPSQSLAHNRDLTEYNRRQSTLGLHDQHHAMDPSEDGRYPVATNGNGTSTTSGSDSS